MTLIKKKPKIPIIRPSEFDDYIFVNWSAPVSAFYPKFHVERIENYKKHLKLPLPPHRRSVHFFIYLTRGKVVRSKGLTKYTIKPNTFFFLPADQITALEYVSKDANGFYCHFMLDIFSTLKIKDLKHFPFFDLAAEPTLNIKEPERIVQLLNLLEAEKIKNNPDRFELIPIYLLALLSEINLLHLPQRILKKDASTQLTQRFKSALAEHIGHKRTIQEFATHLSVSPNHLNKCVQSTIGKTSHELLDEMRILEAKVLLLQTDLTIREIAYNISRFEPSDFARFFKSKTGVTPHQFRMGTF